VTPVVVLLPVFTDWQAVSLLLPRLFECTAGQQSPTAILLVDDGSFEQPPDGLDARCESRFQWISILRLNRNLGHQRAIAVGLSYIHENIPCEAVIVMDADGEDRPEDVPRLLQRSRDDHGSTIVFAQRRRRTETPLFKMFYHLYRLVHRVLTGTGVRVGNFSVIPRERLSSVVAVSELWIHYAASVFHSRQPISVIPTVRGKRLDGKSHMNFVSLVVHGLSAISVYSDVVFTRVVVAAVATAGLTIALLMLVVSVRVFSNLAIPGWATYVTGFLLIVLIQGITFVVALTFLILGNRHQMTFVPGRDYAVFVGSLTKIGRVNQTTS
jgi:hypothetical protein